MINRFTRSTVFLAGGVLSLALLAGCGGGGGGGGGSRSSTGTATPAPANRGTVRLRLVWPERPTRALPSAAESVRVTLMRDGQAVDSRLIVRDTSRNTSYDDAIIFGNLDLVGYQVVIAAYATQDATGVVLTQGTVDFPLTSGQPERVAEVTAGQTVTSTVDHVVINNGRVALGQTVTLTATAFNAANVVVPVAAQSLRWSVEAGKGVTVTDGGTLYATQAGAVNVTVTDPDSGKAVTQVVQCGFATQLSVSTSGAAGAVPFLVTPIEDDTTNQTTWDDTMLSLGTTDADGTPVLFQWLSNATVAQNGAPITIKAPATYGDRQFVKWQQGGQDAGTNPVLTLDPKTMTQSNLTAVYTPRSAGADGFTPNELHDHDLVNNSAENQTILWKTERNKISFLHTGLFNEDAKNRAIQGFQMWQKATGGQFGYEVIGDDQPDQADIVVIFSDRNLSPVPSTYVPGYTTTSVGTNYVGLTVYNFLTASSGQKYGTGKRVIYLFNQGASLSSIAAHELGHASGMVGHSEQKNDIMYPTVYVRSLSERDVNSFLTMKAQADGDGNTRALHTGSIGKVQTIAVP